MFVEAPPLRWFCKKIARKSLALGTQYSGSLAIAGLLSREPGVRVLTYHRFGNKPYDPFCVSVTHFEQQMAYLAEHDIAISLAEFESYLKGESRLSENRVLVTIDDGYQSVFNAALPVLENYAIPAVAFITPSLIQDKNNPAVMPAVQHEHYMNWDEVTMLANNNVAIGSHSWTHRSLGALDENEVMEEAVLSRQSLEDRLSRPVTSFAYPFGTRADFNDRTVRVLEKAGYNCAFTSQHGAVKSRQDAYDLPRVKVEGGEAVWVFRSLVKGGLDAWRVIDQTLWRLQANSNG